MSLIDTGGCEDLENIWPTTYKDIDAIIMCFSIDSPDSFENIRLKWVPEVRHYCKNVPIILVGNKMDLRNDDSTRLYAKYIIFEISDGQALKYFLQLIISSKLLSIINCEIITFICASIKGKMIIKHNMICN